MKEKRMIAVVCSLALLLGATAAARGQTAHVTTEPVAKDGTAAPLDLPRALQMKNTGGNDRGPGNPRGEPGKGSGLCVFTSINHAAYWQNVPELQGFQKWMTNHPGGGYPEKVKDMIDRLCKEQGRPVPEYMQVESNDLEPLKLAVRCGLMPSITYSYSPTGRYGGKKIAHMVTLVAAGEGKGPDGKGWWAVLDNNFPGSFEWMSEAQFLRAYKGDQQGWAVILLNPGPPPVPFLEVHAMHAQFVPLVLALAVGQGQWICGPDGCRLVQPFEPAPPAALRWHVYPDNPAQAFLFRGPSCVAGYDLETCVFRRWDGAAWGPAEDLPREAPAPPQLGPGAVGELPTGVVRSKLGTVERYELNGQPTTREHVCGLLNRRRVEAMDDTSSRRHLTIICRDQAQADKVMVDLRPGLLGRLRGKYRVQVYAASRPADSELLAPFRLDADTRYKTSGFVAYMQEPDSGGRGKVVGRSYSYDGPAALEAFVRKVDPNFDPNPAPAPPAPPAPSDPSAGPSPKSLALAGGGLLVLILGALKLLAALKGVKPNV